MSQRIQIAFDVATSEAALDVLSRAASEIDVIEAGTVLCLSEGLDAVRRLRAAHPTHPLVADIRIGRAGEKFAEMAFSAGASIVTVLAESGHDVVSGALVAARRHGGGVEVELGPGWSDDDVSRWVDAGVSSIIVHRPLGIGEKHDDRTRDALERLSALERGDTEITLAGGLSPEGLASFDTSRVGIVVIGSAVVNAADPVAAIRRYRDALAEGARS